VALSIRPALPPDTQDIRRIHRELNRPQRQLRSSEYLVAVDAPGIVGCAAVRMFKGGGYLYGLAVQRESQRRGVGLALTSARLDLIRERSQELAVVMAMFWNVGFFYKLGFRGVRRDQLPSPVRRLADFRNPRYKHSAVLWRSLES
jgi:N-acetylglutamate synthase-like GNAT family acetyltransferase